MFQPRAYRTWIKAGDLISYTIKVRETDLFIRTLTDLSKYAHECVVRYRHTIEDYIQRHSFFAASFSPLADDETAPEIIRAMLNAASAAGVGPMASVAGAISQFVGQELFEYSDEVIIENGGDNFIHSRKDRIVSIYAGNSPQSGKIGLIIHPSGTPSGICTSSGTVGPSISLGKADAAVVVSRSAVLADAAASAVGNVVCTQEDIPNGLDVARSILGVDGTVIIKNDRIGAWGNIELCDIGI